MNEMIMPLIVLLPILLGVTIPFVPLKGKKSMMIYIEAIVLVTSALAIMLLMNQSDNPYVLFSFAGGLDVGFKLDGAGSVFVGIVSLLWPLATLYAFEYMAHEKNQKGFFAFYTITYGVTLGIALAKDILTMYIFYEALSLVTIPLVIHTLSREAIHAARKYMYYSLGGAAFAFIGIVFILTYGTTPDFTPGGVLDLVALGDKSGILTLVFFFGFLSELFVEILNIINSAFLLSSYSLTIISS